MLRKTITIDMEAYARLKQNQLPKESISQVIKRLFKAPPRNKRMIKTSKDLDAWLKKFAQHPMSEKTARAIEDQVSGRLQRSRGSL